MADGADASPAGISDSHPAEVSARCSGKVGDVALPGRSHLSNHADSNA
jgi:hypothetical protein